MNNRGKIHQIASAPQHCADEIRHFTKKMNPQCDGSLIETGRAAFKTNRFKLIRKATTENLQSVIFLLSF